MSERVYFVSLEISQLEFHIRVTPFSFLLSDIFIPKNFLRIVINIYHVLRKPNAYLNDYSNIAI